GIAILEKNLTPESLNTAVFKLLGDRELLVDMANASKTIGKPEG
ncbi:undecaprenyldiphospho-muramoylpentapeptide beta-N-acetylglucosaminyltransferase, partial [Clostridioides difficile]